VEILKLAPDCKVLLMSGAPNAVDYLMKTPVAWRFELLAKPILPRQLIAKIARYIGPRTNSAELASMVH